MERCSRVVDIIYSSFCFLDTFLIPKKLTFELHSVTASTLMCLQFDLVALKYNFDRKDLIDQV